MKKKVINAIAIVFIILAGVIMHELLYALSKVIPYPVALGILGGFGLGYLFHQKP